MNEGGSAASRAHELREQAAAAQAEAARLAQEATAWEAGAKGEMRVAEALSVLTRKSNAIVMHDRLLRPGRSHANLDHIVVSAAGTHLIDAKNWLGNVTVYQGSLWRHKADGQGGRSSQCMNAEIDKVRRMAETMETRASCVVEPVLCLTGLNAHAFGAAQLIRGVHVVPVDQITKWLAHRERTHPDEALPALAQRVDGLFPTATGPWSGLTPEPNGGNQIGSDRTLGSRPIKANAGRRKRIVQSSPRRPSNQHRLAKSVLVLVGMLAFVLYGVPLGAWVVSHGVSALMHLPSNSVPTSTHTSGQQAGLPKARTGTANAAPVPPAVTVPSPPCRILTESAISKTLGVRVYPVATASPDTCQWGLRLDDASTVVASASTGWMAAFNTVAIKANRAIYQDGLGSPDVSIIVPQHVAVPGSKVPPAQITQPIKVSLAPNRLDKSGRELSNDQARSLITKWAQQIATVLPQGPGAETIRP